MEIYDVVVKLVGPIDPVGETHTDEKRFENLKAMTELVGRLVGDIAEVMQNEYRPEHSMSKAGKYAMEFLESIGIDT